MAIEYNTEISRRTVVLSLNFINTTNNQKVAKTEGIIFDIITKSSSDLDFAEQLERKNQRYQVNTTLATSKGRKIVDTTNNLNKNSLELEGIQIPELSGYEIDATKVVDTTLNMSNGRWVILKGQNLWLSDQPNPDEDKRLNNGCLKYIAENKAINIFLKPQDAVRELSVVEKDPLSRIAQFDSKVTNDDFFNVVDNFTEFENNLFYLCIAQFYNSSSHILRFSSRQIKELVGYDKHVSMATFIKMIDEAFKKFLSIQEVVSGKDPETGEPFRERRNLFSIGRVYEDSLKCEIQVNDAFEQFFNELKSWTRFSIVDYARIHSSYSKKLFRLLKAFRTTGVRTFSLENFKKLLHVPEKYGASNINQRIMQTCMIDLAPYFSHLSVKNNHKKGSKKIVGWTFYWNAESNAQPSINKNNVLSETHAIYNIKNNSWLTRDQKFKSIDKYRGYRIGTTKKAYEQAHPNTYFFDSKKKRSKDSEFVRPDLKQVYGISMNDLKEIIHDYENYNRKGILESGDIDDLVLLEKIYVQRQLKLSLKSRDTNHPNLPNKNIIAGSLIMKHFKFKDGVTLIDDQEDIKARLPRLYDDLDNRIRKEWASDIQVQDHRPTELKLDFDEK